MNRTYRAALAFVTVVGIIQVHALPASAANSHSKIEGTGSTWAAIAVNQWVADVASSGIPVDFTPTGSARGRQDFAQTVTDFGVSDIGYRGIDSRSHSADVSARPYAYLPIVAGGTAFPYKIMVAGKPLTGIRLSGLTIAKIFAATKSNGKIEYWDDPAILADNNNRPMPHKKIIPVVHAEGAGSTAQFTSYLAKQFPAVWTAYNGGDPDYTEYFPVKADQVAQNQSDSVMNYITGASGDGAIGYDEYSYALGANIPAAKVLNAAGNYTLPTQYNDAVALTLAQINMDKTSPDYLLQNLTNVYTNPDPRTYPLSSYSYGIIPTSSSDARMDTYKRQTLADFLAYSVCNGQGEVGNIGYSSLPLNLVQRSFEQIGLLKAADPNVELTSQVPTTCNNPTFDPKNPNSNKLAVTAPAIPACDHKGAGPCDIAVAATTTGGGVAGATPKPGQSRTAGTGTGGVAGTVPGGTGTPVIDPVTGQTIDPTGGTDSTGTVDASAVSTTLASSNRTDNGTIYGTIAVGLLLVLLLAPPLLSRRLGSIGNGR